MRLSEFVNKNKSILLFILFVMSFTLKVVITYREYSINDTGNWSDALLYLDYGKNIASGVSYSEIDRNFRMVGPIIPSIVASSIIITGDPIWPVLVLNCLLSALLVYVLFELGKKTVSITAGFILAVWSVINFNFIKFNYQILKEPLVFLLVPLIILCLINIFKQKKALLNAVYSSLLFSLLIHTDERFVVYLPLFLLFIYVVAESKNKIRYSLLWLAILLISMIPWTIRNYNQYGDLVILTPRTTAITSKIWGTDLAQLHFTSEDAADRQIAKRKDQSLNYSEQNQTKPRLYGRYERYYKAFIHYWQPLFIRLTYIQYGNRPVKWSLLHNLNSLITYGIFLPFYIIGFVLAILRKKLLLVFLGFLPIIHSLLHTLMVWPLERYRITTGFLVVLVSLWLFDEIYIWQKGRKTKLMREVTSELS